MSADCWEGPTGAGSVGLTVAADLSLPLLAVAGAGMSLLLMAASPAALSANAIFDVRH